MVTVPKMAAYSKCFDLAKSHDISAFKHQDRIKKSQELSIGEAAGTEVLYRFGFDGYNPPIADHRHHGSQLNEVHDPFARIRKTSGNMEERKNFADIEASNRKWIPGPNMFNQPNWMNLLNGRDTSP